jgi:HAD superfamily hydrolase (TIGR01509 family)
LRQQRVIVDTRQYAACLSGFSKPGRRKQKSIKSCSMDSSSFFNRVVLGWKYGIMAGLTPNNQETTMIKAILWDNDGVLVDTEKYFFQATRETLASVGMTLTQELFIEFSLIKGYGLCEYMQAGGLDPEACEELRLTRNRRYSELLSGTPTLIDGVRQTLEILHGRVAMGVVTSSAREHFDIIHRSTGLTGFFDFVITSDECEQTKPHPEPYLKGLERLKVRPEECVAVEDSARGLVAANRAKLHCLMIPHALSAPETYTGQYILLESINDVPEKLTLINSL